MNFVEKIGAVILITGRHIVNVSALLFETIYWILAGPFKKKFPKPEGIFGQMVFAGFDSLIIASFVAFFTGIVIAMQSAYQLARFGANIYVAPMVSIGIARELGPVL
ncbi:MAG: ABC transporter permease, partial [Candidatus Omnitrophica bacterium]|nr:ABC transporter permease [Candidatus Omnitrophota bacterium]